MSDHQASLEGSQPPSRHRSPTLNDPRYHYESLNEVVGSPHNSDPHTRPRLSRTTSSTKGSPPSTSPPCAEEHSESGKKSKLSRNTLKKLSRRDSHHSDTSSKPPSAREEPNEEEHAIGYTPKLSQIREGKASTRSGQSRSSAISSTTGAKALRRRHTDDNAVSRSRVLPKHGSLQRRADAFAEVSDPYLFSTSSSVTEQSSVSSTSNTTVTQGSYDDYNHMSQHKALHHDPGRTTAMDSPTVAKMNAAQSEVFRYLQSSSTAESLTPTDLEEMPPSTMASSSSSSGVTRLDDGTSSDAGNSARATDSTTTSPASTRKSGHAETQLPAQKYLKSKKPLYASSFVHGPEDDDEGADSGEGEDSASESESESESEGDQDEDAHTAAAATVDATPPRVPSSASRQSDPHARRLKQQERELANHILRSPQPHKEFQFGAGPHAQPYSGMPLYSPRALSVSSPASVSATAHPPSVWPPMPPFPAPLPISYAPHQSPEATHAYPLAVRPPIGAPDGIVQRMQPPLPPHSVQPPHYQEHVPAPNHARPTMIGYELLADKLSEPSKRDRKLRGIMPMYRKFESLNHRVLLHLQDEVCELEEELRHLDECIAQISPRDESGYAYPASRRGDARYGGEMHYKRTELLGRIFQKLEQYNRALSSFSNLSRNLDPATTEDISAYRAWMDEDEPVDYVESQFLERESDLVTLSQKTPDGNAASAGHRQSAAVWFPLILVLPLMAFAIVPNLLGRLLVIVLIVGAELMMVTSTPELNSFMSTHEWTAAASVYFGLNVLLAAFVR